MADDRTLKILLQIRADIADLQKLRGGVDDVKKSLGEASTAGSAFGTSLVLGAGIEIVHQLTSAISAIPRAFEAAMKSGVEMNARIETSARGIGAVLATEYGNLAKGLAAAGPVMDTLREKAIALGLGVNEVFDQFQRTSSSLWKGGIQDLQQQIDLTIALAQATETLGIPATQAANGIRDILEGNGKQGMLANVLGLDNETIANAREAGTLVETIMSKLSAFTAAAEGPKLFDQSLQNLRTALLLVEAQIAKPIFDQLKVAFVDIATAISNPAVRDSLLGLSQQFAQLIPYAVRFAQLLLENAAGLVKVASVAVTLGIALAGSLAIGLTSSITLLPVFTSQVGLAAAAVTGLRVTLSALNTGLLVAGAAVAGWQIGTFISQLHIGEQTVTQFVEKLIYGVMYAFEQVKAWILTTAEQIKAGVTSIFDQTLIAFAEFERAAANTMNKLPLVKIDTSPLDKFIGDLKDDQAKTAQQKADAIAGIVKQQADAVANIREQAALLEREIKQGTPAAAQAGASAKLPASPGAAPPSDESGGRGRKDLSGERLLLDQVTAAQRLYNQEVDHTKLLQDAGLISAERAAQLNITSGNNYLAVLAKEQTALQAQNDQYAALASAGGVTNRQAAEWDRVRVKLGEVNNELLKVKTTVQSDTFTGTLRKGLVDWVNGFGTAAKQVSGFITGTLNTALASTSQALTALIFKTGNWKQAFASAAQSIVQNIIQIVLQWTVGRAVMAALNLAFGKSESAAVNQEAVAAAAAWAPAATSASVASYGAAAGFGAAAYAAALVAGTALATGMAGAGGGGGFREGGFTGGVEGRAAGVVHGEEFVFSAPATRTIGAQNLDWLHKATVNGPSYAAGGYVAPTSFASQSRSSGAGSEAPEIHIFALYDTDSLRKTVMNSDAAHKIIFDAVRGRRLDLGIG